LPDTSIYPRHSAQAIAPPSNGGEEHDQEFHETAFVDDTIAPSGMAPYLWNPEPRSWLGPDIQGRVSRWTAGSLQQLLRPSPFTRRSGSTDSWGFDLSDQLPPQPVGFTKTVLSRQQL